MESVPMDTLSLPHQDDNLLNGASPPSTLGRSPKDRYGFFVENLSQSRSLQSLLPPKVVVLREKKWLEMLGDYKGTIKNNYKKLKERCRKGIPKSIRPLAWQHLSCSKTRREQNPDTYQICLKYNHSEETVREIDKDLARAYPTHEMFSEEGLGQSSLKNVLLAYTRYDPVTGYCQAHAPLAALLLMQLAEEDAFWLLVALSEDYLPGYFEKDLERVQLDGEILFGLLKKVKPKLYEHFIANNVPPVTIMVDWFMCIYGRSLPWSTVLRVWDIFLFEGVIVLFKVGLVILMNSFTLPLPSGANETQEVVQNTLKKLPAGLVEEDFLIDQVVKLSITKKDFKEVHTEQLKIAKERKRQAVSRRASFERPGNGAVANGQPAHAGDQKQTSDISYNESAVFLSESRRKNRKHSILVSRTRKVGHKEGG